MGDNSGKSGDVTDIKLSSPNSVLNISLKNNNSSIKHQRPRTTPIHIGLEKNSPQNTLFILNYSKINSDFYFKCKNKDSDVQLYNEVESLKNEVSLQTNMSIGSQFIKRKYS